MDFLNKLKQRTAEAAAKTEEAAERAFHEIVKVPDEIREQRLDICRGCEHLTENMHRCRKCGCFMEVKTWLPQSKCPIDKWDVYHVEVQDLKKDQ